MQVVLLAFTVLALPVAAAESHAPVATGVLEVPSVVEATGSVQTGADGGAIHIHDETMPAAISLDAEAIHVQTGWREGVRTETPDPISQTRFNSEIGREHWNFSDAQVKLSPFLPSPQLLALTGGDPVQATQEDGLVQAQTVLDRDLVRADLNPDETEGNGPFIGFWYSIPGPWVAQTGLSDATLTGDFTLFVNNVTIDITTADGDRWTNWTGHQTYHRVGPVGTPDGSVTEYEVHVTLLHVTNGTLSVGSDADVVELYAPRMTSEVSGVISSPEASGAIESATTLFEYEGTPLEMEGNGTLGLAAESRTGFASGQLDQDAQGLLSLNAEGMFTVRETPGLASASFAPPGDQPGPLTVFEQPWLLFAVGLPLLAAVVGVLVRPQRNQGQTREVRPEGELTNEDFEARMEQAKGAYNDLRFHEALDRFEALTQDYPTMPQAWDHLAKTLTELGRLDETVHAYERLSELLGARGPGDLEPTALQGMIPAYYFTGHEGEALDAFRALARQNPKMAIRLIEQPGLSEIAWKALPDAPAEFLDRWLAWSWGRDRPAATARRVFAALLERDTVQATSYVLDEAYEPLIRMASQDLPPHLLRELVTSAWKGNRLALAQDLFIHLAFLSPLTAWRVVHEDGFEALGEDVRVVHLFDKLEQDKAAHSS